MVVYCGDGGGGHDHVRDVVMTAVPAHCVQRRRAVEHQAPQLSPAMQKARRRDLPARPVDLVACSQERRLTAIRHYGVFRSEYPDERYRWGPTSRKESENTYAPSNGPRHTHPTLNPRSRPWRSSVLNQKFIRLFDFRCFAGRSRAPSRVSSTTSRRRAGSPACGRPRWAPARCEPVPPSLAPCGGDWPRPQVPTAPIPSRPALANADCPSPTPAKRARVASAPG